MTEPREDWRPPFCPDRSGCSPLLHPLTDGDNMALNKPGYAVFCWGRLAKPLTWTFDGIEHAETLSTCQSSPLKGNIRWLENESDWSALARVYPYAIRAAAAALATPPAPTEDDQ